MVEAMVTEQTTRDELKVLLTPNRSATWQFNCLVLKLFGTVVFVIAIAWSLMGVWMILPFAGLEFGCLVYFVYRTSQNCYRFEVLCVNSEAIRLEKGLNSMSSPLTFDRLGSEFIIKQPTHIFSPASISLAHRGKKTSIGRFLNKPDVDQLTEIIKKTGIKYSIHGKAPIKDINPFNL